MGQRQAGGGGGERTQAGHSIGAACHSSGLPSSYVCQQCLPLLVPKGGVPAAYKVF